MACWSLLAVTSRVPAVSSYGAEPAVGLKSAIGDELPGKPAVHDHIGGAEQRDCIVRPLQACRKRKASQQGRSARRTERARARCSGGLAGASQRDRQQEGIAGAGLARGHRGRSQPAFSHRSISAGVKVRAGGSCGPRSIWPPCWPIGDSRKKAGHCCSRWSIISWKVSTQQI